MVYKNAIHAAVLTPRDSDRHFAKLATSITIRGWIGSGICSCTLYSTTLLPRIQKSVLNLCSAKIHNTCAFLFIFCYIFISLIILIFLKVMKHYVLRYKNEIAAAIYSGKIIGRIIHVEKPFGVCRGS